MPVCDESEQSRCPKCGVWQDDLDGFGVQLCAACGFCQYPSLRNTDGHLVCLICGKKLKAAGTEPKLEAV